ncbi:MAG TPA: DUF2188 domain-containing protein [Allosphingosinicella sp.]|nr:DUF2188 domain-containing protein [Allosphingosinicella sp.]
MSKPGQHVIPSGGKWSVRRAGATRASAVFETQAEAIERAREIAQNQATVVFIHGRDGLIREREPNGRDSYAPKA